MTEADNSASTNRQTVWTTSSGNDNNDSNAKDTGMISAIKFVAMNPGGAELVGIQSKYVVVDLKFAWLNKLID